MRRPPSPITSGLATALTIIALTLPARAGEVAVAAAAETIPRGVVIQAADLVERTVPEAFAGRYLRADEAVGQEARRQIRADLPISRHLVQTPTAIDRGDRVKLTFRRGTLVLEAGAIARESGAVGDSVSVTTLATRRAVQAVVAGPGRVIIE